MVSLFSISLFQYNSSHIYLLSQDTYIQKSRTYETPTLLDFTIDGPGNI